MLTCRVLVCLPAADDQNALGAWLGGADCTCVVVGAQPPRTQESNAPLPTHVADSVALQRLLEATSADLCFAVQLRDSQDESLTADDFVQGTALAVYQAHRQVWPSVALETHSLHPLLRMSFQSVSGAT